MSNPKNIAQAIEEPREVKKDKKGTKEKVLATTTTGKQYLFLKPTRHDQKNNPCWHFNEYVACRLGTELGLGSLPALIVYGLNQYKFPMVGIPYNNNLVDLGECKDFELNSFSNSGDILSIVAFDLCVLNSDRAKGNLFVLTQGQAKSLIAYDFEKSFLGNGKSDLHRIKGKPTDKKIENFFQFWLRSAIFKNFEKEKAKEQIVNNLRSYTHDLPKHFSSIINELPTEWLNYPDLNNNIAPLEQFLLGWWKGLPGFVEGVLSEDSIWLKPTKHDPKNGLKPLTMMPPLPLLSLIASFITVKPKKNSQ